MRKFTLCVLGAAMTLGMYAQDVQVPDMYIIGSAVGTGQWNTENFLPMEYQGDNVYTWTGDLKARGTTGTGDDNAENVGFRFTLGTDWWPGISPQNGTEANGYQICEPGTEYIVAKHDKQPDPDARFQVAATGTYSISINLEGLRLLIVEGEEYRLWS